MSFKVVINGIGGRSSSFKLSAIIFRFRSFAKITFMSVFRLRIRYWRTLSQHCFYHGKSNGLKIACESMLTQSGFRKDDFIFVYLQ